MMPKVEGEILVTLRDNSVIRISIVLNSSRTITKDNFIVYGENVLKNAKKVALLEGIQTISKECFMGGRLEEIELPSTIKTIGDKAFQFCEKLKEIELPKGLETIGNDSF